MTRLKLVASAKLLSPPSAGALNDFSEKRDELAARVIRTMAVRPDLERLVGQGGRPLSEDNNRNFPLFIESIMAHYEPEVLVDTAVWAFRTYRAHGFDVAFWPANLSTWIETLKETLSPESFQEVSPFFVWLLTNVPGFTELTDPDETFERSAHESHVAKVTETPGSL